MGAPGLQLSVGLWVGSLSSRLLVTTSLQKIHLLVGRNQNTSTELALNKELNNIKS